MTLLYGVQQAINNHKMVDEGELVAPLNRLDTFIDEMPAWTNLNGEGNDHLNKSKAAADPTWSDRACNGNDLRRMGTDGYWPEADKAPRQAPRTAGTFSAHGTSSSLWGASADFEFGLHSGRALLTASR